MFGKKNKKKRFIFYTQYFYPEPNIKGIKFVKDLIKENYSVDVITGFPNSPYGKIYEPYKLGLFKREKIEDVQISRLFLYPNHSKSIFLRLINYISFSLSSLVYCIIYVKKTDILYVYQPPATLGAIAAFIKFFKKNKFILDIQDLWPENLIQNKIIRNKIIIFLVTKLCNFSYKNANHIITNSNGYKKLLIKKGIEKNKISTVYNWSSSEIIKNKEIDFNFPNEIDNSFKIVFAGNIGEAQSLYSVIKAASIINKTKHKISFIFIGEGIQLNELKNKVNSKGIKNVIFLKSVPMEEINFILRKADALLVHLKDLPIFRITIPSKIQSYMSIGKPILAAVEGEALELIKKGECGIEAIPENPESIAEAAIKLSKLSKKDLTKINSKSKNFYNKNLSMNSAIKKILKIIKSV